MFFLILPGIWVTGWTINHNLLLCHILEIWWYCKNSKTVFFLCFICIAKMFSFSEFITNFLLISKKNIKFQNLHQILKIFEICPNRKIILQFWYKSFYKIILWKYYFAIFFLFKQKIFSFIYFLYWNIRYILYIFFKIDEILHNLIY